MRLLTPYFQKAHKASHMRLLNRIGGHGIRIKVPEDCLTGRRQRMGIKGVSSGWLLVTSG